MILREPCLPPGWYPRGKAALEEFLAPFARAVSSENLSAESLSGEKSSALAAMAPHAGWYYSGRTAARSVASLDPEAETVAVIGGHLPRGMPVLAAAEDAVKTPLGIMDIDAELRREFEKLRPFRADRYNDNTVEVLLPMARYFFPKAKLLWLRFPAEPSSFEAGKLLREAAENLGRRLVVVASTDLTHYGNNYGFSPRGKGKPALDWVKNVNDAAFIAAVLAKDPAGVLKRAEEDFSACSAGAVLGALGFISSGDARAALLDYTTSADAVAAHADAHGRAASDAETGAAEVPDSFVGYAAVSFG